MITEDERFIKIQGILAFSDIHPEDCIKINDLIIELSKENQRLKEMKYKTLIDLQERIDKAVEKLENWKDNWYANSMQDDKEYLYETLEILKGCKDVKD